MDIKCVQPAEHALFQKRTESFAPWGFLVFETALFKWPSISLQAIFEADMQPSQYDLRPRRDAKEAVRQVHHYTAKVGLRDVVDTDLRDYLNTIPHGPLMKCLARRISDGRVLRLIKQWLEVAVIKLIDGKPRRTNEAKHTHRGSAQGSVISPLLANVYFRRFILAWERFGYAKRLHARMR
jgi:retron-type reverse transcriptase